MFDAKTNDPHVRVRVIFLCARSTLSSSIHSDNHIHCRTVACTNNSSYYRSRSSCFGTGRDRKNTSSSGTGSNNSIRSTDYYSRSRSFGMRLGMCIGRMSIADRNTGSCTAGCIGSFGCTNSDSGSYLNTGTDFDTSYCCCSYLSIDTANIVVRTVCRNNRSGTSTFAGSADCTYFRCRRGHSP